jgi:hypothetical protein
MTDELKFPDGAVRVDREALSEPIVALVREAYSPPVDAAHLDSYWSGLEQRIMAGVAASAGESRWWTVLAPWARTGLIAAGAIFALAGIINQQLGESESQLAYDSVVEATTPEVLSTSQELMSLQSGPDGDGAAVSYFLSH